MKLTTLLIGGLLLTLTPLGSAHHSGSTEVIDPAGEMACEGQHWGLGDAYEHNVLTGDEQGHVQLVVSGIAFTNDDEPCTFDIEIKGFACIGGDPNAQCDVFVAKDNPCTTTTACKADLTFEWDRCFILSGCFPLTWTLQIEVYYDLVVNGVVVDSDVVYITDPPLFPTTTVTNPL